MIKDSLGFQLGARIRIRSHTGIGKSPTSSLEPTLKKAGHICQDKALEKWYPTEGRTEQHVQETGRKGTPSRTLQGEDSGAFRHQQQQRLRRIYHV